MKNLFIVASVCFFFLENCTFGNSTIRNEINKKAELKDSFKLFTSYFKEKKAPIFVCHNCDGSFNELGQISIEKVKKFFPNEKEYIGHDYYFQFKFLINKNMIGLIYYRTSEKVCDYVLNIYDSFGTYKSSQIIASVYGEYDTYRESSCKINIENSLTIKDLILINEDSGENGRANKIEYNYVIDNLGIIRLLEKSKETIVNIIIDQAGNIKEKY